MIVERTRREGAEADDDVAAAMRQVLEADTAGDARVAESRRRAADAVHRAQARMELILRRADARIARMQAAHRERIEAQTASAVAQPDAGLGVSEVEQGARVADAVLRLAADLTS